MNAVVHCTTVWQSKRRGKQDHSRLQSLTRDRLNVALVPRLALFYWPYSSLCPQLRPPGEHVRSTKTGLCWPTRPKAFSWQGTHKKMLTRYDIILAHTVVSVDYNGRQSAIHRARTPSDRSLLLCAEIVTEQKNRGCGVGSGQD